MTLEPGQVTLLPSQLSRLAALLENTDEAIGITLSQDGSVLHATTKSWDIYMNARGQFIEPPAKEPLC